VALEDKGFSYGIIIWDWKQPAPWDEINKEIRELGVCPYIVEVDTGADAFAIVISSEELTDEEAQEVYNHDLEEGEENE
jgi:hypothetical protein